MANVRINPRVMPSTRTPELVPPVPTRGRSREPASLHALNSLHSHPGYMEGHGGRGHSLEPNGHRRSTSPPAFYYGRPAQQMSHRNPHPGTSEVRFATPEGLHLSSQWHMGTAG